MIVEIRYGKNNLIKRRQSDIAPNYEKGSRNQNRKTTEKEMRFGNMIGDNLWTFLVAIAQTIVLISTRKGKM